MQPHAPRAAELAVQRGVDERVGERVPVGAARHLADHARAAGLLDRRDHVVGRKVRDPLDHLEVELAAEHRPQRQHSLRRLGEVGESPRDHVAHALGQTHPLRQRCGGVAGIGGSACLGQVARELDDEERVALGLLVDRPDQRIRRLGAAALARERGHVLAREPAEMEPLDGKIALEVGQRVRQRAGAVQLGVSVAGHHEQAVLLGRAQQVRQEQERRLVRPVEVVEQQHDRRVAPGLHEQGGEGVEQAEPREGGIRRGAPAWRAGRVPGHLREQAPKLASAELEGALQGLAAAVAHVVPQRLDERGVRDHAGLRGAAVEHERPGIVRVCAEAGEQPGLADARVTRDQRELTRQLARTLEREVEP